MKIAVLSGKGGTGKTLVSVNLAAVSGAADYIDCDVEEPNGHLFFKPQKLFAESVKLKIPVVDYAVCTGCRECVEFCKFNALAYIKKLIIFDKVCHSCGGCVRLCKYKALREQDKIIGNIEVGKADNVTVYTGILNVGEASGVPIIRRLLSLADDCCDTFIDCPPGSACAVMESIKDADYCALVAEPTVFGLHNLQMVIELVKLFEKPHGVILNKCAGSPNPSEQYCIDNNIAVLGKINYDNELGAINSNGEIAVNAREKYKTLFLSLLNTIKEAQK
ncbi:MAG: ATPase [Clostridia bacterium]|nr:ATPase [Clostridia bacterium]